MKNGNIGVIYDYEVVILDKNGNIVKEEVFDKMPHFEAADTNAFTHVLERDECTDVYQHAGKYFIYCISREDGSVIFMEKDIPYGELEYYDRFYTEKISDIPNTNFYETLFQSKNLDKGIYSTENYFGKNSGYKTDKGRIVITEKMRSSFLDLCGVLDVHMAIVATDMEGYRMMELDVASMYGSTGNNSVLVPIEDGGGYMFTVSASERGDSLNGRHFIGTYVVMLDKDYNVKWISFTDDISAVIDRAYYTDGRIVAVMGDDVMEFTDVDGFICASEKHFTIEDDNIDVDGESQTVTVPAEYTVEDIITAIKGDYSEVCFYNEELEQIKKPTGSAGEGLMKIKDGNGIYTWYYKIKIEDEYNGKDRFSFEVMEDGKLRITGMTFCEDTLKKIVIPEEIDGRTVTEIGDSAFAQNYINLEVIVLPETLVRIGEYAFSGCSSLKEILIPDSVKDIGKYAFYNCSGLGKMVIPDGITVIREKTFAGCTYLEEIAFPAGVTDICDSAFSGCLSLKEIAIPDSVTNIEAGAFSVCSELKEIVLPDGIKDIRRETFYNCLSLEKITIPDSVTNIEVSAFAGCSSLKEIKIPDGITDIGACAFKGCSSLEEAVIPKGLMGIMYNTFYDCENLKKIYIPESINYIDPMSIGYMTVGDPQSGFTEIKNDVTIYGCKGTAAETYAQENDLNFIAVMEADDTDIKLEYDSALIDGTIPEGTVKLEAKELHETDPEYGKIAIENLIKDEIADVSAVKLTAYEIKLTDSYNKQVQPSGSITVKIPCPAGYDGNVCKVYYMDGRGNVTDMSAVFENGYMVFKTDHFSTYIVTETELNEKDGEISGDVIGDANGDGEVDIKDAVMLKKHLAGYGDLKINLTAADTTGDGEVNINDAVRLLRYLAGDTVTLGK